MPRNVESNVPHTLARSTPSAMEMAVPRIDFLESEIAKIEQKMRSLEVVLSSPKPEDDIMELTREYLELKRDLDAKTDEWGGLIEQV